MPHVSSVLRPLIDGGDAVRAPERGRSRGPGTIRGLRAAVAGLFAPGEARVTPSTRDLAHSATAFMLMHGLEAEISGFWSSGTSSAAPHDFGPSPWDAVDESRRVVDALMGRCLYRDEVLKCLKEANIAPYGHLDSLLDIAANAGLCAMEPSVRLVGRGVPVCMRCGCTSSLIQSYCPSCRTETCWLCMECQQMGEARTCLELYMAPAAALSGRCGTAENVPETLTFGFDLTPPQADASGALRAFVTAQDSRECLVWAVCGAGKTEVAFAAVHEALRRGQRVLFACPRKDVVLELESRLRETFSWVDIAVLYGGAEGIYRHATLVLSTTHQVLRRCGAFDLAIVDEADAFPFLGNRMLQHGVNRAMAPGARLIYMTATPDARLRARADRGEVSVVTIPARHHRKALPEPELRSADLPSPGQKSLPGRLPADVLAVVRQSAEIEKRPLFVFAPTVELVMLYGRLIREALPELAVETCHSRDEERGTKREAFQRGRIRILVSTSIMERGITVTGCDVVVLNADFERIFEERALVQMAGRAGRSSSAPTGRVTLVGTAVNGEMRKALEHIRGMNGVAASRGYLDE